MTAPIEKAFWDLIECYTCLNDATLVSEIESTIPSDADYQTARKMIERAAQQVEADYCD